MKQLFEYTDNVPLMKDFIFPCLNERICDFHNKSDIEALRCVCKKLNEILPVRISSKCKKYKGKCTTHCKAYPFYKHLDNRYKKHIISLDVHIHFTKKALADMFTLAQHMKSLKDKKVLIVGDVAHSRVARSNLLALCTLGAKPIISGPPNLIPWDLFKKQYRVDSNPFNKVSIMPDLDQAIIDADVVMTLRLQSERHSKGLLPSLREYANLWQVTTDRLAKASPNVLLMHPGPMNRGVEIDTNLSDDINRSVIREQV